MKFFFPQLKVLDNKESEIFYHINLIYDEQNIEKFPVITFVDANSNGRVKDIDALGISGSELVKSAFKNLYDLPYVWEKINVDGELLLQVKDQEYASEKILDKSFLKHAANLLNSKALAIAIPQTSSIFCCNPYDSKALEQMKVNSVGLYNDFGKDQVSNFIFFTDHEGVIQKQELNNSKASIKELTESYPTNYFQKASVMTLFGPLYCMMLACEAPNMDILTEGMFKSIISILKEHGRNNDFNGTIEIQTPIGQPAKTSESQIKLEQFFSRLKDNSLIRNTVSTLNKEIVVTFLNGDDFQRGDIYKKSKFIL